MKKPGLLFESLHGLSRALITDSLFARERLGSTGPGAMAWPSRMAASRAQGADGGRVPAGATHRFRCPDEQPVGLLIFLLVPEAATQKHLEILSEIAELLSDVPAREIKASTDAPNCTA